MSENIAQKGEQGRRYTKKQLQASINALEAKLSKEESTVAEISTTTNTNDPEPPNIPPPPPNLTF